MTVAHSNFANWHVEDEAFLKQLDDVVAQQATLSVYEAEEMQQQQLEQRVWWDWMQAMRDGGLPAPQDWKDPGYVNPYIHSVRAADPYEYPQNLDPLKRYMPTLAALKRAVAAIHVVYAHADANSDTSSAWTYGRRAGDPNWMPYNHFTAIGFISSNEKMIQKAVALVVSLEVKLEHPRSLTAGELRFVQNWIVAREILAKLDDLNMHAGYWTEMHDRYGEWAEPQSDPFKM